VWSIQQLSVWFPGHSRQKLIRRADAFAQARTGDSGSVAALIEIAADPSEGPLTRANAVGYLGRFPTAPAVFAVFERALSDASPMVRAVAALRITAAPADRVAAIAALTRVLADQAATVRLAGAVTLVGMGLRSLPGDDGVRFEQAKGLYQARAEFNSDDAAQQLGAGRFYLLLGDGAKAAGALQNSLRLNPETPAQYLLAYAYAEEAKYDAARAILQKILPADPQYAKAQELLKAIAGQGPRLH
jgi:tetratricopeptide (TPR) repeat protein